ncbi:MAG: thioredoxin fold domain-containing protein [Bacteroidota bacterium]
MTKSHKVGLSKFIGCLLVVILFTTNHLQAQKEPSVSWLSFEQLSDSLSVKPKKVFVDFYTPWCIFCRKMDKVVFTDPEVIQQLNNDYYSVRMNAESRDTIYFEGQPFINDQLGKTRNPVHQLAQLLATRNGKFAPPALIILDENFAVKNRYFEYLTSEKMLRALK